VAAIVGDELVLLSEVKAKSRPVIENLERSGQEIPPELERQIRARALRSLIDEKLMFVVAKLNNFEISPEEIDHAVETLAREEGVSVPEVYAAMEERGYTRNSYREQLGLQLTTMRVIDAAVRSRVSVSDDDVLEIFEERYRKVAPGMRVRLRHILLPWPAEGGREATRSQAVILRQEALAGASFALLARDYSAAPNAKDGGLAVFREGEVAPELADAVFSLEPGEISEPIETQHGVNLLQIVDRFDPASVQLEEVRDDIEAEVREKKTMGELEKWLAERREESYIEIVAADLR
jgi:parvulin-like peptidyl-prolyl isomerase